MIPLMLELKRQLQLEGVGGEIKDEIVMSEHHIRRVAQVLKDQLP